MPPDQTPLVFLRGHVLDPRIVQFMEEHLRDMHAASPPGSVHALDLEKLQHPGLQFWSAWTDEGQTLAATGALQLVEPAHGEIKSMRTAHSLRGRGVASAMLVHLLDQARQADWHRVSLETGSQPFFEPARALYARYGFSECAPFGGYSSDPASCFMSLTL